MQLCLRSKGNYYSMYLLVIFTFLLVPFATPFASSTSRSIINDKAVSIATTEHQNHGTTSARYASTAAVGSEKRTTTLRKFFRKIAGQGDWTKGEASSSLLSRITFQYAQPLLDIASKRRLEVEDAYETPDERSMEEAVPELKRIYQNLRTEAKQKNQEQQQKGKRITPASETFLLTKALFIQQRKILLLTGILRLVNTAVQAFPALLVARLLRLIEAGDANPASKAFNAAFALIAVLSIKMLTENQYFHNVVKYSTEVRGSLAGLIFDKSLRLPGGGSGVTQKGKKGDESSLGVGGVLNLMQSDTGIVENAALQVHTTWDGPLQLAMYTSLLYYYLGNSVFWGIGVLLMTIPINSITLRILNTLSRYENEAKDARTKRTSESISNMKLLKLQAWEKKFADDIRDCRDLELTRHRMRGVVRALNNAISNAVPALVLVVTLTAYARSGRPIVASTIFTAISLFNQLRFPLFFLPMLVDSLANGKIALQRIANYLSSEEIVDYVERLPPSPEGGYIKMENGNFLWAAAKTGIGKADTQDVTVALYDVNFEVKPGEIIAVVGSVGGGKSALIKGLLGELDPAPKKLVQEALFDESDSDESMSNAFVQPSVVAQGTVAYCSQEAWLPKGTLRDAIVFGREFNETRYKQAIYDAGLDMDIVDDGREADSREGLLSHSTNVGEGGSSLSGGQRARVALARALYSGDETKVFLLDDVLAALDASVGATVFERLRARLKRSKAAAVIVTNNPSLPRRCDRVVLMGKVGKSPTCSTILDEGSYDALLMRGHRLDSIAVVDDDEDDLMDDEDIEASSHTFHDNTNGADLSFNSKTTIQIDEATTARFENCTEPTKYLVDPENQASMELNIDFNQCGSKLASDGASLYDLQNVSDSSSIELDIESASEVQRTTFDREGTKELANKKKTQVSSADDTMSEGAIPLSTYWSYLKSVRRPVLIAAMLLSYLMVNASQFYQQLTIAKWTELAQGSPTASSLSSVYLGRLVNAAGVVSVFLWLRSFLTMQVGLRASQYFHSKMLKSVFAAPMSFFDLTPSGQLLSRFGKEMETVDRGVPDSIGSVLFCFLQIFTSIAALAGAVSPAMMIPLVVVGIFYFKTMSLFRPAARDMKRAETRSRSPIYTQFGEALRGVDTIRSIPGASTRWSETHRNLFDRNLGVFFTVKAFDRWLSTRLETLGNVIVFTAATGSVILSRSGSLSAGSVGFGLTQALAITGLLTWAVRCFTDLESNMLSVVRVKELTDIDREDGKGPLIPEEKGEPGEALQPLLHEHDFSNGTLSSLKSEALLDSGWPWRGHTEFRNVSMRYSADGPLILRHVNVDVPAGSTLGVVGRTGSGKSSLLLTLFRLVEIEDGGSILIDGIDLRAVSLSALRHSLAIIPQDPVLFAGTVASNLDATGSASEEDMWAALEAASPTLTRQFRNGKGLASPIIEGGKNLSLGQRQLICLARALLKKSKVLVLDEATSSVDSTTDREVQETIRREFVEKGVTVITVAHRLETVLGYDKILVLGAGEVVEYGSPFALMRKPYGELRRLVEADKETKKKGANQKVASTATA